MKNLKLPALLLAFALLFSLTACKAADHVGPAEEAASVPPAEESSAEPSESPNLAKDEEPAIRLAVLSGPTGIGAAKLLDGVDNNPGLLRDWYTYNIYTDNSELTAGLTSGEIDIAAMASNVAVNLYNKTGGGIKIIAVGTLGVLHILEGGGTDHINAMADLAGKTLYAAGQGANPEYILRYLLRESGLEIGKDVDVVFADASEISAKLLSGEIECAMLPVPAATAAVAKGEGRVRQAVDMTGAWDALKNGSQLIMTAVVARAEFVQAAPERAAAFLADYEDSISFVNGNVDEAAELVAGYGLTPSAAIARQAIPQCHLAYIDGIDMVAGLSDYYSVLYNLDPASVGGFLPDDGIYWLAGRGIKD